MSADILLEHPDRPNRTRKLMSNDDRERPTDPVSHAPPSAPTATLHAIPPAASLPSPDPNSFSQQAMKAILEGMAELKVARKAFDADALLSRQTEIFATIVTERYEMIRGPLVTLGTKLDDLAKTVARHDKLFESGDERFQRIELDMAAMRSQMDRLDRELAVLRGIKDATAEAAPSGKPPAAAGDSG